MPALICILISVMMATGAMAHGDGSESLGPIWTFDPWIVIPLTTLAVLYGVGVIRLTRRSGRRGRMSSDILLYSGGLLSLAGALLSPLHWLGEHLFTFHMIEHEIVMAVSAPLIVLGRPAGTLLWGLPRNVRQSTGRVMRTPLLRGIWHWCTNATNATVIHGVAIWAWHLPVLFDAVIATTLMHRLQHLSFFATAILFWWAIFWKSDHGSAAWHLFVTMIHTSILGALMALAPRVLFIAQTRAATSWGLTPLEDQQLAGMIMWVPAGTVYAVAAITLLVLWIGGSSRVRSNNA